MKRLISVLIVMTLLFATVTSYAALPDIFYEICNNYTADYNIKISFDNGEEIAEFIENCFPEQPILSIFDLRSMLSSLLNCSSTIFLQADIADDYSKMKLAITSDNFQSIDFSNNLNMKISSKIGMWLNMDLDMQNPVFEIIYLHPASNKYFTFDVFEACPEEQRMQIVAIMNLVLNKDFIETIAGASVELYEKYSKITRSGNVYTMKIDNEGYISMVKEMSAIINDKIQPMIHLLTGAVNNEAMSVGVIGGADGPTAILIEDSAVGNQASMPEGIRILGEDGITYKYTFSGVNLRKAECDVDISVNLSELLGEMWLFETPLNLDFTVKSEMKISKKNSTVVQFPELTEENSIDIMTLLPENSTPEYADDEYTYPHMYVSVYADEVMHGDGEYYIPLRAVIEAAYEQAAELEYNKGEISLTSEWFPEFKTLKLYENSTKAYVDDKEIAVSKVIVKDGTTYVSNKLFEDVFGWEFYDLQHSLTENSYYVEFYTGDYYDEEVTYPNFYTSALVDELAVVDDEYYVPFRRMIEGAYDDTAVFGYDNGEIMASCEWFPGFKTVKLYENSTEAYVDGEKIAVSPVMVKDGTTYVGKSFFEDVFGWSEGNCVHYMLSDEYYISFYTDAE